LSLSRQDAETFLYEEARLLDEGRLEEWLELFTSDGLYWLPITDGADPAREPSLIYDDAAMRSQRVFALLHTPHYPQQPPSRTVRVVSNVLVDAADEVTVRCNVAIAELRPGDPRQLGLAALRTLAGRCQYRLRLVDGGWKIALKKVLLIDSDLPQFNLTFIV